MKVGEACNNYGGLFIGEHAAEVLGDYGAGPNHTLPTGGTGRYTGGLSVFNFLRVRTWMRVDNAAASQTMVNDSITMARLEGLEGHARAAETRSVTQTPAFKKPRM
jgi:histidinol dehydrogenase